MYDLDAFYDAPTSNFFSVIKGIGSKMSEVKETEPYGTVLLPAWEMLLERNSLPCPIFRCFISCACLKPSASCFYFTCTYHIF